MSPKVTTLGEEAGARGGALILEVGSLAPSGCRVGGEGGRGTERSMRGGRGGRGACASRGPASGGCRARVEPRTPPEAEAAALEGVERRGPGDGLRRLNWRGYAAGKGGAARVVRRGDGRRRVGLEPLECFPPGCTSPR